MTYTPTPTENTSYTEVADGANDNAAAFNVFLEGLADMVEWLRRGGLAQAYNWGPLAATPDNVKRGVWNPTEASWFAVGDGGNDFLDRSQDGGRSWVSLTGSLGSAIALIDITCKPSTGDMVLIASGSRTVYVYTGGTYGGGGAFAPSANSLSAVPSGGAVGYDVTAGKYIAVYRVGATGHRVDWDVNGSGAWTAGALPAAWGAYAGAFDPDLAVDSGIAIALFFDGAPNNKYHVAKSTDGGGTWADVVVSPTTFNAEMCSRPVRSPVTGYWFFAGSRTSGSRHTEVFRSTDDGASWVSRIDSAADMVLQDLAALGPLLVGVNDDGRIYVSSDDGATWALATNNPITVAARPHIRAGGGQLCVWNSADKTAACSLRWPGAA